ncbi:hypothetical protein ASY01nite_22340 [Acetobacter syzygii]|nr:hypothetical protein Absy_023_007 [Acetobacter syzygii]GBR64548.1 hypothetical protein AA0483_1413 [Acetobacter syzygii NRIC 0483]GEL57168.1 hypothetical protein ASY01nite_22340 [Acetobacter syzygii]
MGPSKSNVALVAITAIIITTIEPNISPETREFEITNDVVTKRNGYFI